MPASANDSRGPRCECSDRANSGGGELRRRQSRARFRCDPRGFIELQPEPVRKARKVVEDAHDVTNFEASLVVETEAPQRLPVGLGHARWGGAELVGDGAEGAFARSDGGDGIPRTRLDGFHQLRRGIFEAQKLCVRLRSVVAVLSCGGDPGYHFAFRPREGAGGEHDLRKERAECRANGRVGRHQTAHGWSKIDRVASQRRRSGTGGGHLHPGFRGLMLSHARSLSRFGLCARSALAGVRFKVLRGHETDAPGTGRIQ